MKNKKGWITGVFIVVLIIFAIILLVIPAQKEQFDPNEHVCLVWNVEEYYEGDDYGGKGIEWVDEDKGIYRRIFWSSCVDGKGNRVKDCGGGIGYNENQADCDNWRPKNICELEPEVEHPECVCLERESKRCFVNITYSIKYMSLELFDVYFESEKNIHKCLEFAPTPDVGNWGDYEYGKYTKARLRNICDDGPNHEDCECDEWGEKFIQKDSRMLRFYAHQMKWLKEGGHFHKDKPFKNIKLESVEREFECIKSCPNTTDLKGCEISDCYEDINLSCIEIEGEHLQEGCGLDNVLVKASFDIVNETCIKAHPKERLE